MVDDEYFMRLALAQARLAYEQAEVPVGAVVVQDGKVIGAGFNQPISGHDPSAHAEMLAIRQAALQVQNYRLVDCTLYVTLEPCTMCTGLLIHSRIKRLVYGASEPKAGAIVSAVQLPQQDFYNHKLLITEGVLAGECAHIMSDFFAMRRAQKKATKQDKNSL